MIRRTLFGLLILLAVVTRTHADPARFVVMGDAHPDYYRSNPIAASSRFRQTIDVANGLKPEFVVIVGDMIHGFASTSELKKQWRAFDEAAKKFAAPVYVLPGNHDVFTAASELIYRRRYGKLWYSAEVGDLHLVFLDSEERGARGRIAGEQLTWLKRDLSRVTGKRIFVFVHQPLWERDEAAFRACDWGRNVHPLLVAAGVDTVFCGHKHRYEKNPTRDGVRYINTGGAGSTLKDDSATGEFNHCLLVTAPSEGPATIQVAHAGRLDPEDIVTTDSWRQTNRFLEAFQPPPLVVQDKPVQQTLSLGVNNTFPEAVRGTVSFVGEGVTLTPARQEFSLPVAGTTTLVFEAAIDPAKLKGPVSCRVEFAVGEHAPAVSAQRWAVIPMLTAAPRKVEVDGSLEEWTETAPVVVNREDQVWSDPARWAGPGTLSASAWVGRDERNLYVAVRVIDPHYLPTSWWASSASGDSVMLYLDGRAPAEVGQATVTPGLARIEFAPGKEGAPARIFFSEGHEAGVRAATRRTAEGYTLEAAIPLCVFPCHGPVLGFDLSVCNKAEEEAEQVMFWQGNPEDEDEPDKLGRVRVGEDPGPTAPPASPPSAANLPPAPPVAP